MKKQLLYLLLLLVTFINVDVKAQDSTGLHVEEGFFDPFLGTWVVPKTYMSVNTVGSSSLDLSGSFTLETWIKMPSNPIGGQLHLIETYSGSVSTGGFVLRISGNKILAYVFDQVTSYPIYGSDTLTSGAWNHIAATFNDSTGEFKTYLNGVLDNSTMLTASQHSNNVGLYIGARGDDQDVNDFFEMDEVRIWNDVRTEAELLEAKDVCLTGNETNLVTYYDFEGLTSSTVLDRSLYGNNGVIIDGFTQPDGVFYCSDYLGVDENLSYDISIYPNPATTQITITDLQDLNSVVRIIDITGQVVKTFKPTDNTVDINDLIKGVYFLQVQTNKGITTSKFIKE